MRSRTATGAGPLDSTLGQDRKVGSGGTPVSHRTRHPEREGKLQDHFRQATRAQFAEQEQEAHARAAANRPVSQPIRARLRVRPQ